MRFIAFNTIKNINPIKNRRVRKNLRGELNNMYQIIKNSLKGKFLPYPSNFTQKPKRKMYQIKHQ